MLLTIDCVHSIVYNIQWREVDFIYTIILLILKDTVKQVINSKIYQIN